MNREAAQASLDRIRIFNAELEALEQRGVLALDPDQRRSLHDYHRRAVADLTSRFDLDRDEGQRRMSLGMRIASIVGAVALSAAIFLFFYRIWGVLSVPLQIAVLVSAPIVGVALTELAHRLDRTRHFVFIAAVIACASIVVNVALLGDIFAMADSPNALAVWAAFALAIGYAYGLRLPVAVGLVLAMVFGVGEALAWRGVEWSAFDHRPEAFLPLAAVVFALGAARSRATGRMSQTYRVVGLCTAFLTLWWLSIEEGAAVSVLPWALTTVKAFYQVIGFAASAAAVAAGLRRGWNDAMVIGTGSFVIFLYTKLFQWWWDWMPAYLFFLVIGLLAIATIAVLRRVRSSVGGFAS